VIGAEVAKVRESGGNTWYEDQHVPILRQGRLKDAYWTYGFSPIDDETAPNGIGGVISILTETTKRKALERSLRDLAQSLQAQVEERTAERNRIWQVSQDMLLINDFSGVFLNLSPAWTRVLGWTEEELVGRTSEWLEHPDDRDRTRAEIVRLAERGWPTLAFENRFRTRAGDCARKNRTISRLASGPRASVNDPAGTPTDHAWPVPRRTHCSNTARLDSDRAQRRRPVRRQDHPPLGARGSACADIDADRSAGADGCGLSGGRQRHRVLRARSKSPIRVRLQKLCRIGPLIRSSRIAIDSVC